MLIRVHYIYTQAWTNFWPTTKWYYLQTCLLNIKWNSNGRSSLNVSRQNVQASEFRIGYLLFDKLCISYQDALIQSQILFLKTFDGLTLIILKIISLK